MQEGSPADKWTRRSPGGRAAPEEQQVPLRAGVIGSGHFGTLHAEKWSSTEGAVLVGMVDTEPGRRRKAADSFGVPVMSDFREMLDEVNMVSITVPAQDHYEIARECLQRGIHVLVEKPIATRIDQADELISIAREKGLQLQVGHLERYNLVLNTIRDWVERPVLVSVRRMVPWSGRCLDVDVVLDLMIHDIDWVAGLVDSPLVQVKAEGGCIRTNGLDVVNARLYFRHGCVADLVASRVAHRPERTVRVIGGDTRVDVDLQRNEFQVHHHCGQRFDHVETHHFPRADLLRLEVELFIDSVLRNQQPLVNGETGRRALAMALKVSEVANTGESWIAEGIA